MSIWNWLQESNRWKHLVGGFLIGMFSFSWYTCIYAVVIAASSLEMKDILYGNEFDIEDWLTTIFGGVLGYSIYLIIKYLLFEFII